MRVLPGNLRRLRVRESLPEREGSFVLKQSGKSPESIKCGLVISPYFRKEKIGFFLTLDFEAE
jgi:hypothetical protein